MSEKIEDMAFPFKIHDVSKTQAYSPGMDLRDYFAGKALQGIIASYDRGSIANSLGVNNAAAFCYEMADALMAARKTG